ncbi:MAG: efflux RND transporter periplasmic adaptor subunit [Gemmatimonadota bacterium]
MNNVPFGSTPSTARRRTLRIGAMLVATVVILAVVKYFTRPAPETATATSEHPLAASQTTEPTRTAILSAADQQRIGVTFAVAEVGTLQREIRTVAQVVYDETRIAAISLKVDGWIDRLDVNSTGESIRRGDPLFALYSPMLVTAQQELLLARRLAADVSAGSPGTRSGAAELSAAARRRLLQWDVPQAEIEAIERDGVAHRTITFLVPENGVVVDKNVVQGQRVMAGETLYRTADLGRVWLDGEVFGQDLASVRVGQDVIAEFPAMPGKTREGRITFIYPTLGAETRTAHVRVELANPGLLLKPGMYATIRFSSTRSGALTVPRSSVLATGERSIVFVRDTDGGFVARDVVVGEATDERIEILHGLKAGEVVVASGTFLVDAESNLDKALGGMGNMPGMDVKPTQPKSATGSGGAMPGMDMRPSSAPAPTSGKKP